MQLICWLACRPPSCLQPWKYDLLSVLCVASCPCCGMHCCHGMHHTLAVPPFALCFRIMGVISIWLAGWAAAMVLLVRWWGQLQAKANGPDTAPLLEDESTAVHSTQHSFVSSHRHHSRHPYSSDAHGEAGLIEQQGSGVYEGYQGSDTSSSNRGVLPGLSKRRRLPPATLISLHGQCHHISLGAHITSCAHTSC